nr:MAG TPA: hypothetical protein [Caudoviricetes sp.]
MKYFYKYQEKNGDILGGHNLEKIEFIDYYIRLLGVDFIPTIYGCEEKHWTICLNMKEIEYLKIEPMIEKE